MVGIRYVSWIAIVFSAGACRPTDVRTERLVAYDSAGVRIVEIHGTVWDEGIGWTLSEEPLLEIGVLEGDPRYELYRLSGARRLSDGRIAVVNGGSGEVRIYDSEGVFVQSIGGLGDGPGEFRDLRWLQVLPGDTLLAIDAGAFRLTAFSTNGKVVWTRSFTGGGYWFEVTERPGDVRLPDGSFVLLWATSDIVARVGPGRLRPGQTGRESAVIVRYSPLGAYVDTLAVLPGIELAAFESSRGGIATTFPPMGRVISYALGHDRIYVGTQESFEIREYLHDGTLVGLIRQLGVDLTITEADLARDRAQRLEGVNDPASRREYEDFITSLPLPESKPAYGRLVVDASEHLWISEAFIPGLTTPARWSVFDSDAGLLGDVDFPENFDVYEIGHDYVLGCWKNDDGVEYVRLYELIKSRR